METGDEDVLLAESLTTMGMIYCKLKRYKEAQQRLDAAYRLASRCGHTEGAGRAQLILVEEMAEMLQPEERAQVKMRLMELVSTSQQSVLRARIRKCLDVLDSRATGSRSD